MDRELPPGKAAIAQWMHDVRQNLPDDVLEDFLVELRAGEYIMSLDYIDNIKDIGWSDEQIEHFALQLGEAWRLMDQDPHPEYINEDKINELIEKFMRNAGYKGELDLSA